MVSFSPQVITTMCVPSAWMNMKKEINSESCRALMVSDYSPTTVTLVYSVWIVIILSR